MIIGCNFQSFWQHGFETCWNIFLAICKKNKINKACAIILITWKDRAILNILSALSAYDRCTTVLYIPRNFLGQLVEMIMNGGWPEYWKWNTDTSPFIFCSQHKSNIHSFPFRLFIVVRFYFYFVGFFSSVFLSPQDKRMQEKTYPAIPSFFFSLSICYSLTH